MKIIKYHAFKKQKVGQMDMNKINDNNWRMNGWFFAGIASIFLAVVVPFLIMILSSTSFSINELSDLGPVGDFYGGSTIGLLSIASIFFIIHTISIQSKELSLQREELKLTREELQKTRQEHSTNNEHLKRQQFDSTFFNLLNLHNSIVENTTVSDKKSKEALLKLWSFLSATIERDIKKEWNDEQGRINNGRMIFNEFKRNFNNQRVIKKSFEEFYSYYDVQLGHYYRNLYRIIKFIEENNLNSEDKRNYRGILRAQLSTAEIYLIFYNIHYSKYGMKFRELLKGTHFFEGHIDELLNGEEQLSMMNNQKFEEFN